MSDFQFIHLGRFGRSPRKGQPAWSCVAGITAEGARVPSASRHIRYRGEPRILHGSSPLEAGRLATERADQAFDHGRRLRRLRRDGIALLAGVVSYPIPRRSVDEDPCEQEIYYRWRLMTLEWLKVQFGSHLHSVVEHADEDFLHLHFFVVPGLQPNLRLNWSEIHPGQRMKTDAAEAGACKKFQDAAYRSGLSRWQDDFWWEVSRHFGHERYGPKRQRVSRRQRLMEKRVEEQKAREQAALAAERENFEAERAQLQANLERERESFQAERAQQQAALAAERETFDAERAQQRADLDRERVQMAGTLRQEYEKTDGILREGCVTLKGRLDAERARRQAADAEIAALRARLAELEPDIPLGLVA